MSDGTPETKLRMKERFARLVEQERVEEEMRRARRLAKKKPGMSINSAAGAVFIGFKGRKYLVTASGAHVRVED